MTVGEILGLLHRFWIGMIVKVLPTLLKGDAADVCFAAGQGQG